MSKVFVVGASGYIGSVFCSVLDKIVSVVSCGRQGSDINVDLNTGDDSALLEAVASGDVVLLLASVSSPDICAREPDLAYRVNVTNTVSLVKSLVARNVRVIFSSSDAVFGNSGCLCSDDDRLQPIGEYGEMKAEVERAFSYEPLVKVVRFSYVVGQGDKYTEMLKSCAANDESVEVFSGFGRNVVSIDDVVEGLIQLIEKWNRTPYRQFNFSGPELVEREELTAALAESAIVGLKYKVVDAPAGFWVGRARTIETNCIRFTNLLGRKPRGLQQIVAEWR